MVCYIKNTMNLIFEKVRSVLGLGGKNDITPRIADNTVVTLVNNEQYAYIPLTPKEETNNMVQVFVKPGTNLTVKRGVNGSYDKDEKFRYGNGPINHYLVEGLFTNSEDKATYMSLLIPRKVVEKEFVIKRDT